MQLFGLTFYTNTDMIKTMSLNFVKLYFSAFRVETSASSDCGLAVLAVFFTCLLWNNKGKACCEDLCCSPLSAISNASPICSFQQTNSMNPSSFVTEESETLQTLVTLFYFTEWSPEWFQSVCHCWSVWAFMPWNLTPIGIYVNTSHWTLCGIKGRKKPGHSLQSGSVLNDRQLLSLSGFSSTEEWGMNEAKQPTLLTLCIIDTQAK